MRSESLSSQIDLDRHTEDNVAARSCVQNFRDADKTWWQLSALPRECGTRPFADLHAGSMAMGAADLNAVWILADHEVSACWSPRPSSGKGIGSFRTAKKPEIKRSPNARARNRTDCWPLRRFQMNAPVPGRNGVPPKGGKQTVPVAQSINPATEQGHPVLTSLPGALMHGTIRAHQVMGRVDQREVREGLRKVSQLPALGGIVLFGQKADVVAQ